VSAPARPGLQVLLAQPRGFCAGVVRAITIVERALELHGAPVYVYHEIVHNRRVVEDLRARGAVFVDTIADVPRGALLIFSAHGVGNAVVAEARERGLEVIDATCPLVSRVHARAQRYARLGYEIVVVGHPGHEEVVGTVGAVDGRAHVVASCADVAALPIDPGARVAYVTQTTLSLDDTGEIIAALRARFAGLVGPALEDICYATQNRQRAVRALAAEVDVVLVVGARNSSNSTRLAEVARQYGCRAHLVADADELEPAWFADVGRVGITAGASTPEVLVQGVRDRLLALGAGSVRELPGTRERVSFRLPPALARVARPAGPA